jgi:hypothetical protein
VIDNASTDRSAEIAAEHVGLVIEGTDARRQNVLSAFWWGAGRGPELGIRPRGRRHRRARYLCYSTDFLFDDEGSRALACLQPGFDEEVIRDVVERALLSNGKDFGITLIFRSPPSEFSTVASDDVLRRAFESVRDEADDEFGEWEEYVEAGVFG